MSETQTRFEFLRVEMERTDENAALWDMGYMTEHEFTYTAEQLKQAGLQAADCATRAVDQADKAMTGEPYSINSLGVLQSSATELDRLAAVLNEKNTNLMRVRRILLAAGAIDLD
jgi:hypothetical protein